ncbi:YggT family protein [Streptococcus ovis]|uniref:YggT family protein n=1 Tax=Streptococcus ovis TaxID=82806 RepID=UPI000379349E|nr:YggT family protein [Streptococcus ovis]
MKFIILTLLQAIEIYSYVLLAYVLLSWIPSLYDTFLGKLIIKLVRPVLTPFRKLNLQFFGLDWTIVLIWFILNILSQFLWQLLAIL